MVIDSPSQVVVPPEQAYSPELAFQPSAMPEQHKLPAVLGTRDLTVLMLLIVLFVANNDGVQFGGPAAFVYWVLGLLTFLVPCAFVTRWLALRYPGQGAPYLWATRILGQRWSFFSAFCAWLPGVLAVVSAVQSGLIFIQYLVPTWFTTPLQQGIAIVFILIVPTAIACLPLRWVKRILLALATLYVSVFLLLGFAGVWWLSVGRPAATMLTSPQMWLPNQGNFAVYGVVILAYLGVDIPLFMGGELRGGTPGARRATAFVWWGSAIAFIAYMMGTFGIMVIVPSFASKGMGANILAIQMVFGATVGTVTAIVLAVSQVALTIAYILMFSRLLVVVAQDRRLPISLAKVNRYGVPAFSIVIQGFIVAIVAVLSLILLPALFGSVIRPDDLALAIYNVLQAGTTVIWVCTIVQLFWFVLWLLYRRRNRIELPSRQRLTLLVMSLVGSGASLIGIWATVSSSWLPTFIPNSNWAILVLGITIISFLVGLVASELPRVHALLREQKFLNDREVTLRSQLQEGYDQQQVLVLELDRLYREQARAAITDAVTGLPNHRAIMSRLDEELSRSQRTDSSCAVVFVDLDHFKRINDTYGHRAGDAILREVGSRLRATVRLEDFVGRYGGEEFAVILTETDVLSANQTAQRLLIALNSQPFNWEMEETQAVVPIAVSGSIGVAIYQLHGITREELIECADQAMYQAKKGGRNRVCIADVEPTLSKEIILPDELREAGDQNVREIVGMQALTAAAAARDGGTLVHAYRLAEFAVATARKLGQSEEDLHLMRLGAILHDIGKIGIPDTILYKPGPLTEEEWVVMRTHSVIGRQILEEIGGVFQQLATIIVAHHERWDGTGYPNQLAGEAIPVHARILTVVDAFDAMTSRRVYREPLSTLQARAELLRCSGNQFDSQVVEAFLQVLDEQGNAGVPGPLVEALPPELTTEAK